MILGDFGLPGGLVEPSQKKLAKRTPTVIFLKALLEAILDKLCSRIGFW